MYDDWILLNPIKISYQATQIMTTDPKSCLPHDVEPNSYLLPTWAIGHSRSQDFLDITITYNKAILEAMMIYDRPWDKSHH